MNNDPSMMHTETIKSELESIPWEYVVAADKAQNEAQYNELCDKIDERKKLLEAELKKREGENNGRP